MEIRSILLITSFNSFLLENSSTSLYCPFFFQQSKNLEDDKALTQLCCSQDREAIINSILKQNCQVIVDIDGLVSSFKSSLKKPSCT